MQGIRVPSGDMRARGPGFPPDIRPRAPPAPPVLQRHAASKFWSRPPKRPARGPGLRRWRPGRPRGGPGTRRPTFGVQSGVFGPFSGVLDTPDAGRPASGVWSDLWPDLPAFAQHSDSVSKCPRPQTHTRRGGRWGSRTCPPGWVDISGTMITPPPGRGEVAAAAGRQLWQEGGKRAHARHWLKARCKLLGVAGLGLLLNTRLADVGVPQIGRTTPPKTPCGG